MMQRPATANRSIAVVVRRELKAMFGSPMNAGISIAMAVLFAAVVPAFYRWAIGAGTFNGVDRKACVEGGACWVFLRIRMHDLMYGGYPQAETWRVNFAGGLLVVLIAGAMIRANPWRRAFVFALPLAYPIVAMILIAGGFPGLPQRGIGDEHET